MVMTNSTYDGLCYNIDAIKETIGDSVEILHFDEAWYAYANFHEFYDGYHGISSSSPARSANAITFATHSTHKLLGRIVAGLDDPYPARREQAAGHGALQRRVHDAHLDLAAIRHHRLLRCRGGDDGAARGPRARPGDDRGGAQLPPRDGGRQEAGAALLVVRRLAARRHRRSGRPRPNRTGS